MEWLLLLLLVGIVGAVGASRLRAQRAAELERQESLRAVRRVADEDVTRFGEELQELHIDTMTTELDTAMRQDYQRALDAYESAKELLADARVARDVREVTHALEDGRYAHACVLARQAGTPLPERRPPCFFNPGHGPAQTEVLWAPPGGVRREVPVCMADAQRLEQGAEPDTRMVRSGNRMIPWYRGGPAYAPYAFGYYDAFVLNGVMPAFLLGAIVADWHDPAMGEGWGGGYDGGSGDSGGGDSGGGDAGGGDSGGGDAGGGWFDGGGFDGGGFDGGGGF